MDQRPNQNMNSGNNNEKKPVLITSSERVGMEKYKIMKEDLEDQLLKARALFEEDSKTLLDELAEAREKNTPVNIADTVQSLRNLLIEIENLNDEIPSVEETILQFERNDDLTVQSEQVN